MVTSLKRLSAASKLMAATGNFSLPWANLKGKQAFFGLLRGLARLSSCRCTCCLHLRTWPNSSCCTALSAMPCLASMFSPLILRCNAATKRTASTNLESHKMLKPLELASQAATHTSQNCRQCRNTIHFHAQSAMSLPPVWLLRQPAQPSCHAPTIKHCFVGTKA